MDGNDLDKQEDEANEYLIEGQRKPQVENAVQSYMEIESIIAVQVAAQQMRSLPKEFEISWWMSNLLRRYRCCWQDLLETPVYKSLYSANLPIHKM